VKITGDTWQTESFPVKLSAMSYGTDPGYSQYAVVPVKSRVVNGTGAEVRNYEIHVGSDIYIAPDPTSCGSPGNSGFQILVLDRNTLGFKDHRTFNVPCGNSDMLEFLDSLDETSLVMVSSLASAGPSAVCNGLGCPLGINLMGFGASEVFFSNRLSSGAYTLNGDKVPFTYSLIGNSSMGQNQGTELNSLYHKAHGLGSPKIHSNIKGVFVKDVNGNWSFTYPDFYEVETRSESSAKANTIKVGRKVFESKPLLKGAKGGFQVLVLEMDTLERYPSSANRTFSTNAGTQSESEQERMVSFLKEAMQRSPQVRYIYVIVSIGTPIDSKTPVFTKLAKIISNYFGGTFGVFNDLGTKKSPSYSLVGLTSSDFKVYPLGAIDAVEESGANKNLRVVLQKGNSGWFKPIISSSEDVGQTSGRPDFSLVSHALQPDSSWPLPDPSDPLYNEQVAAYTYISGHVNAGSKITDIRAQKYASAYLGDPTNWGQDCEELEYADIPDPSFSEAAFVKMKLQLCGKHDAVDQIPGEFDYLQAVLGFESDLNIALLNLQISDDNDIEAVYDTVKETIDPPDTRRVAYNTANVARGLLGIGSSVIPQPEVKLVMGAVNGLLGVATALAKPPSGADYATIDAKYEDLRKEMRTFWNNYWVGSTVLMNMIKSDWDKLKYVGAKLMTPQDTPVEEGGPGWMYDSLAPKQWQAAVKNTLQATYFRSLIPTLFSIDYQSATYIEFPANFAYDVLKYRQGSTKFQHNPYCSGSIDNPTAYQAEQFLVKVLGVTSSSNNWYVLSDEDLDYDNYYEYAVDFGHSEDLRDILFGKSSESWGSGRKLGLDKRLFYERWLPSSVYRLLDADRMEPYKGSCND